MSLYISRTILRATRQRASRCRSSSWRRERLVSASRPPLTSPEAFARRSTPMPQILVIHGAGMNMRGKVQTEIFGPMTLPQYDEKIRSYASDLGLDIEIFHSNVEGEIVNKIYAANDGGID